MSLPVVRDILNRYEQTSEQEIAALEHQLLFARGSEEERSLLYALRVSHCVPSLRSLLTLASRWNVANSGAGGAGMQKGRTSPNFDAVQRKLSGLFLAQFQRLGGELTARTLEEVKSRSSSAIIERKLRKARDEIGRAFADLKFELPGLSSEVERWLQRLANAPERIDGSAPMTGDSELERPASGTLEPKPAQEPLVVGGHPPAPIDIEVLHAPTLNFAMEQSGVPIVGSVRMRNTGSEALSGLTFRVLLGPDLGEPLNVPIPSLRVGEETDIGPLDIRLPAGRLRGILEAERARLRWSVHSGEHEIQHVEKEIDLLAYNEWPGARAPSALLAVFVTPNHPVVTRILQRVRDRLREQSGDDGISGYQTRSKGRVLAQIKALYAAIQDLGVSYIGLPASFEQGGQKVRLPDVVLDSQMGNCLDISLLFASCIEQMGLAPLLAIVRGHALPGVWLVDERFPEGVIDDAPRLRNQVALSHVLLFDSSTAVASGRPGLEVAVDEGQKHLARDENFVFAVDVRVARTDRYRPLPIRMTVDVQPIAGESDGGRTGETVKLLQEALAEPEPPKEAEPAPPPTTVVARFQRWKERLLDTSLRNRLLNYRPGGAGSIPLRVPDLHAFEDLLAASTRFDVLPRPAQDSRDARSQELMAAREIDRDTNARLLSDMKGGRLHTSLLESELLPHAKKLYRQARTDLEEGGANTLYAAIGLLKWYEAESSESPRFAPLILYPVRLDYTPKTRRLILAQGDDEPVGNATLVEKMRVDFGLDLQALIDVEADESGIDIPLLLRKVREGIQRMPRWEVLEEVHVGLFTFSKYLMWRDLDENAKTLLENPIVRHIAEGGRSPLPDPVGTVRAEDLDDQVTPADLPTVVDADSTQLAAMCAALRGRSFVLQGPPGTGKSQTITNLVAASLAAGKSVLFVSEKMAALEVVSRRLKEAGLEEFCLELHSNKANKKQVLESFRRSMERTRARASIGWDERTANLGALRAKLNAYVRALHASRPLGRSFYHASARVLALKDVPRVSVDIGDCGALTKDKVDRALEVIDAVAVAARKVEPITAHPWRSSTLSEWSGTRETAIRESLEKSLVALDRLERALSNLTRETGVSSGDSLEGMEAFAELCAAVALGPIPSSTLDDQQWESLEGRILRWIEKSKQDEEERGHIAKSWREGILEEDLSDLLLRFERHAHSNALVAWFALRASNKRLRSFARGPLSARDQVRTDLIRIRTSQTTRRELLAEMEQLGAALGGIWTARVANRGALQDLLLRVRSVRSTRDRCNAASNEVASAVLSLFAPKSADPRRGSLAVSAREAVEALEGARGTVAGLAQLAEAGDSLPGPRDHGYCMAVRRHCEEWRSSLHRLREWCHYQGASARATQTGLRPIVEANRSGQVPARELRACAERSILEYWVELIRDQEPALREFDGDAHSQLVDRFRSEDRGHITLSRERVVTLVDARRPANVSTVSENSEPGILQRELRKQRRHMAIRNLFQKIPNLLPRLKPCLLMSPLSVAQYLPAGARRFDLLVFDEASQIGTHDAIGAVARADQVVIVGDSKQLPPTSFFSRSLDSDDDVPNENDVEELESILDEAVASQMPQQSLGWHYRSRHESLIEFSNRHYYERKLHVFPSARGRVGDLGIKWHQVEDGVYEKGRSRTNPREAKALVDWLVGELKRNTPGTRTFGVVTFSLPQQTLVLDLLDDARAANPEIEGHFSEDIREPVFVKNLENVQGDERDEILFSICYGPNEDGRVYMNFGPINRSGGERRLNVAITRARSQLRVFSSLTHDMIDLSRTQQTGARHLRAFLQYAMEQGSPEGIVRGAASVFDSDFERQVFDALVMMGYGVECQVGCGGYRIDLAVRHPSSSGVFVIGVECDGASYHSGATARDRDRLRQQVLQGLGWKLHRIWSSDWWFEREREVEKLQIAVERALESSKASGAITIDLPAASVQRVPEPTSIQAMAPVSPVAHEVEQIPTQPYRRAQLTRVTSNPEVMYEHWQRALVCSRIREVVEVEAPIHLELLARFVGECFGVERVTKRVAAFFTDVLRSMEKEGTLVVRGEFVWSAGAAPGAYSTIRTPVPGEDERSLDQIPLEELAAAARWYLSHSLSLPYEDLARATARVFGVQSLGKKVDARMRETIYLLVARGLAKFENEQVERMD